jgi:hypothetical protein
MTALESLDIVRPPRDAVRLGKKWTEIPGVSKDRWQRGRVMGHMQNATAFGQRAVLKRKRRLWPWLLALYGTPIALAVSVVVALWLLRHGL